jgi:GNAT superfamily N-acetyltransferase
MGVVDVRVDRDRATIEIRPAVPADSLGIFEACVKSIRACAEGHYSPKQIDAWEARIEESSFREKISRIPFLVADTPTRSIAGFIALNPSTREVEYVYVHPDYLGSGLGRRLIEAIEILAKRRRLRKLHLVGSLNALGFYEHMGFVAERTIMRTLQDVQIPCVMMSKRL